MDIGGDSTVRQGGYLRVADCYQSTQTQLSQHTEQSKVLDLVICEYDLQTLIPSNLPSATKKLSAEYKYQLFANLMLAVALLV
jgi:hypothetical protein